MGVDVIPYSLCGDSDETQTACGEVLGAMHVNVRADMCVIVIQARNRNGLILTLECCAVLNNFTCAKKSCRVTLVAVVT